MWLLLVWENLCSIVDNDCCVSGDQLSDGVEETQKHNLPLVGPLLVDSHCSVFETMKLCGNE